MIRTWFSTNKVLYNIFLLSGNALRLIINTMVSDREIALLSNQLVCFFIAIIVKGFQGPSVFLDSWALVFETGFCGSPSLLDMYKMQAIGICRSQSVQSTQLTEIYSQLALCGTSCFPIMLCARGVLTTVYNFCKTKTTQIVAMVFEGFIFYQTFNFNLIKKERERQCLPLRLSLLCLLWNSLQLSGEPQRSAQAHKKTHIKRARELLYFVWFVQSQVTFKIINYTGMCFTGWQQLCEGTKGLRQKDGLRQKF